MSRAVVAVVAALAVAPTPGCADKQETAAEASADDAARGFDASPVTHQGAGVAVAVVVTWPDAPAALLDSTAVNRCGGERRALVSVHTLHGVRDAVVWLDGVVGSAPADPPPMVELLVEDCQLRPVVSLAAWSGARMAVTNADEQRHEVTVERVDGSSAELVAALPLPIVGRRYELDLEQPGVYRVATAADGDAPAYLLVPSHPYYAVTDAKGRVEFAGVGPGTYAVTAWHRPLVTGAPAKQTRGSVVVVADASAELELSFTR